MTGHSARCEEIEAPEVGPGLWSQVTFGWPYDWVLIQKWNHVIINNHVVFPAEISLRWNERGFVSFLHFKVVFNMKIEVSWSYACCSLALAYGFDGIPDLLFLAQVKSKQLFFTDRWLAQKLPDDVQLPLTDDALRALFRKQRHEFSWLVQFVSVCGNFRKAELVILCWTCTLQVWCRQSMCCIWFMSWSPSSLPSPSPSSSSPSWIIIIIIPYPYHHHAIGNYIIRQY